MIELDTLQARLKSVMQELVSIKKNQRYNFASLKSRVSNTGADYDYAWVVPNSSTQNKLLTIINAHQAINVTDIELYIRVNNSAVMASPTVEGDRSPGTPNATIRTYRRVPGLAGQQVELSLATLSFSYPITVYVKVLVTGTDDVTLAFS